MTFKCVRTRTTTTSGFVHRAAEEKSQNNRKAIAPPDQGIAPCRAKFANKINGTVYCENSPISIGLA
jgi:hypothetical protein